VKLLEVQDVHTYYGDSHVLKGVNLEVETGAVVAVLGRNGMGKTTLMRTVMGLTPARRGRILYQGVDIAHLPTYKIARLGLGYVPQGRRLFVSLTTKENLIVAMRPGVKHGFTVEEALDRFPNLRKRLQNRASKLSGGEQQMVAIGRALMGSPNLVLLDEPTEGLSPLLVSQIAAFIREIREQGISVLIVEQSLPFAVSTADRAYIMSKGTVVHECRPSELQGDAELKHRYLGV
jgi:branched-chain amino acid transport system ATP-binding protein